MHPDHHGTMWESSERPYSPETAWGRKILAFLGRLAAADVPVLITGETGVGKEVLARAIHAQSSRASAPFVKLNCAALPSELIESELFGYERGAFTGAYKSTRGMFESAERGTILLDEIGDMDLRLQAKLLQVLQDSKFLRVGGRQEITVDVRVIAATHQDLPLAVRHGSFRQDLYYRLNVVSVTVPPLRERVDEILPLVQQFRRVYAQQDDEAVAMPPELLRAFMLHNWPGNIRELENTVRKYLVMREPEMMIGELERSRAVAPKTAERGEEPAFPPLVKLLHPAEREHESAAAVPGEMNGARRFFTPLDVAAGACTRAEGTARNELQSPLTKVDEQFRRAETEAIISALNSTLWNRKQAADLLNVDYKALLYKMKKLGLVRRAHA